MKKGQVFEARVERVDFPNKGVVQTGEGTVIVKNSLPGQIIKFNVSKVRKGKAEGRLLEVMEKSPLETGLPCSHFGVCGGCTYLSLPYEEQLRIKEGQVRRLLEGALARQEQEWIWEGIKGSPAVYEYRNKMEFSFGDEVKDGPLALGMHKRGSFYDVVTVGDCRIVDGDYRQILQTALAYFAARGAGYFHKLTHRGYLRHLLVRKASGTGEILAAIVTTSQEVSGSGDGAGERGETANPDGRNGAADDRTRRDMRQIPAGGEEELLEGFRDCLLSLEREGKLSGRFAGILHIVRRMWCRATGRRRFTAGIIFMRNFWGFVSKFLCFLFFRPIPTARKCFTRRRESMWAISEGARICGPTRSFMIFTAGQAPSPS